MINHARTLLLNLNADATPGYEYPGEHVVPSGFVKLNLPSYLDRIRARLFGSDPDRAMMNYRLQQYMQLLHASQYAGYVTDLDTRVTYLDKSRRDLFDAGHFTPNINRLATLNLGNPPASHLQGSPVSPDARGRTYHRYEILRTDVNDYLVTTSAPTNNSTTAVVTFNDNLSSEIPLGDSGYGLLVDDSGATGDHWLVDFFLRPTWSLGEIVASMESIGEPTLLQLFGVASVEPYLTFRNLWNKNPETPDRLAGLLLATIYRTEEVRTGG